MEKMKFESANFSVTTVTTVTTVKKFTVFYAAV